MLYVLQQLEPQQFYSDNLLQDYKKGDKDLVVPVCVRVHGYFSLACYFTHTGVFTNYAVSRRGMYLARIAYRKGGHQRRHFVKFQEGNTSCR